MRVNRFLKSVAITAGFLASTVGWAGPGNGHGNGGGGGGGGGGNTGNGQDTPVDVYLYHVAPYGILGDEWQIDGDATLYPANSSGDYSCAKAIETDQSAGFVKLFVPTGDQSQCIDGTNRFVKMRSAYDLDQDGLCEIPYTGRSNSGSFSRYYDCAAGPEPDGLEDVMVTIHLSEVLGASGYTPISVQIRLLDYGDAYVPSGAYDPNPADIEFIGSQERAFVIDLVDLATSLPEVGATDVRVFENTVGNATICQVVWKNAHSHDCAPIVDQSTGDPIVIGGLTIKGKVDPTPAP